MGILGLLFIIGGGFIINYLGYRYSKHHKFGSIIILGCILFFVIIFYTYEERPFLLSIAINDHKQIEKITIKKSPIQISLKIEKIDEIKDINENIILFIDKKERIFASLLSPDIPKGSHDIIFEPYNKFLTGSFYVIWKRSPKDYFILTVGRLLKLLGSNLAVLLVWLAGATGKMALLAPNGD